MPSVTANGYRALIAAAFLVAVLGGIWRGIASCGGYAWHAQAMSVALAIASLSLVLYAPSRSPSLPRRALLAVAVVCTYFLARALSALLYPALPGPGDYFRQAGMALLSGPC